MWHIAKGDGYLRIWSSTPDGTGDFEDARQLVRNIENLLEPDDGGTTTDNMLTALEATYHLMRASKPNDRSEQDRAWAIAITDMQKLVAFFNVYVAGS